jgi:hypothetical protein
LAFVASDFDVRGYASKSGGVAFPRFELTERLSLSAPQAAEPLAHEPLRTSPRFDDCPRLSCIADLDALDVFASSALIASIISYDAK